MTTVCPTLVSASVLVESRNSAALECIVAYQIEVIPTNASEGHPRSVNSGINTITVHGLNFCKSNYTFRITVFGRNNDTYNDTVFNVVGDLNGITILFYQQGNIL